MAVDTSSPLFWIIVAVVAIVLIAILAAAGRKRAGHRDASRHDARATRAERVRGETRGEPPLPPLDLAPLTPGARTRYRESWEAVKLRFVDDPRGALSDAQRLVTDALRDRGYPTSGDDDHVARYLAREDASLGERWAYARNIASRQGTTTEDMRRALASYGAVLDRAVGEGVAGSAAG